MSFLLKKFFNFINLGANFNSIKSLKKRVDRRYNKVAPIVVAIKTNKIPHHLPKTNPANNKSGVAKPNSKIQIIEKIKNDKDKNIKFSFLYFKITSLFDLINS